MELKKVEIDTDAVRDVITTREAVDGLGEWSNKFPFYAGDRWQDYISDGGLVKEIDTSGFFGSLAAAGSFLLSQPAGTLFVAGSQTAVEQIPRNYYAGSPTDIPQGFYKINTRLQVIKPDYKDGTITRYTFRLRRLRDALAEDYNPKLVQAAEDLQNFVLQFLPFIDPLELNELGIWVQTVQETTLLTDASQPRGTAAPTGTATGTDSTDGNRAGELLPLLVSGAGIVTGSPLLIGAGFLLRFIGGSRVDS